MQETISANVQGTEMSCLWVYADDDQLAITLVFDDSDTTTWVFARDILFCALNDRFAGEGDVAWIVEDHIARLHISSPEGSAEVLFNRDQVEKFYLKTLDLVPMGCETYDIDAALTEILGG